ncbi:MAG: hypothetical protein A3I24_00870 [Candidatus Harrisonbacteria bacterium RIFCSPLOWO2_02_FULL_41_13b]|uniref:Four helix bundle protein n=1 Tax=Candidatus Harrisonbacteria bacterium RIFCSPLOWO2_02_FULL_41_13b TaxID=1798409 RepID=A0A1G1ZWL9_9BACT|nr:MAG: hypothetical protein A3J53_00470 [Candidatus Harrisonbacteria bacterium RIFCSPHIGHO2_02_FULL_40_20]OGY68170.1 MAG: hypothetical protein A3I24_00870 [Candidatus Harrisonbacteria bacterium RIFCSPLOWO2_02_FULL_41_13b]
MNKFRFLNWKVYKDSKSFFRQIILLVKEFPKEYRFEFISQLIRSSLSIVLNIAEGSGKNSDKELNRYISIAMGSVNETLAILDVLRDCQFLTEAQFNNLQQQLDQIDSQLGGFKKQIRQRS